VTRLKFARVLLKSPRLARFVFTTPQFNDASSKPLRQSSAIAFEAAANLR
jgi:hypothetical protein